ncbi:MAG: murein biosynthesis integral membrane protein MurJ [Solirubrobacterales bacterium]
MSPGSGSADDREPDQDPGAAADAELVGASDPGVDASYAALLSRREVERIEGEGPEEAPGAHAGVARNTAIFSIATGLSRVAGLAREILAASYFGTSGAASAFTIAFQLPNLVRGLFADAALSAAFVPVFAEFLEQKKRREAVLLASTLFWIILLVLGILSAIFILAAGVIIPLFIPGDQFTPQLVDLAVGLSQVLFPIVVLLGINGLLVGIVNSYHHFTIPALSPLVWNVVIIALLVLLRPAFDGPEQIYAYAIGVLVGTVIQLLMVIPVLGRIDFRLRFHLNWRDPGVKQVFVLLVPVTIGLGVINIDLVINSVVGALISESAPRAIDAAFRLYMLPQGIFSVALATVLFPSLSRLVARGDTSGLRKMLGTGTRQNLLLLIPAAAMIMVLAAPVVELVYQYGAFNAQSTEEVSTALFWFAFSLPFAGVNLLLTRTFFSLRRPWVPTALAAGNLVLNAAVSLALYKPLGIAGPVIGTVASSVGMTTAQMFFLRRQLNGSIEGRQTAITAAKIILASAALAGAAWGVWSLLDSAVGDAGVFARLIAVIPAVTAGSVVYVVAVQVMRVPEAAQIRTFLASRLQRRGGAGA